MATPRYKRVLIYLEPNVADALDAWAAQEQRSRSAQVRVALTAAVPKELLNGESEAEAT